MKRVHSLRFETLETRQLLSAAHNAVAQAAQAASTPLVLNGTLNVDSNSNATSTAMNADGSTTTSVPVAGQFAGMGQVHGVWNETVDAYGDYEGPDTLFLRSAKGRLTVAFNDMSPQQAHPKVRGTISYEHPQRVEGGSGAFAGASESGTIEVTTNASRSHVVSLTLHTQNT